MCKSILFLALFWLANSLWAADPRAGTWELNAAKSKFPGEAQRVPKNGTMVIRELDADQLELTFTGTRRDGSPISEKFHEPIQGGVVKMIEPTPTQRSPSLIRTVIAPRDFYSTFIQDGKQTAVWHWVVSKDLRTIHVMIKGTDNQGKPYEREALYDKK